MGGSLFGCGCIGENDEEEIIEETDGKKKKSSKGKGQQICSYVASYDHGLLSCIMRCVCVLTLVTTHPQENDQLFCSSNMTWVP